MANVFLTNTTISEAVGPMGRQAMWQLKEHLQLAGWTPDGSGDGTGAYSATLDVITTHADWSIGGWIVLTMPGSPRQIHFRQPSNGSFYCGYSYAGLYTGGGVATSPTATDEKTWFGYGPPGTLGGERSVVSNGGPDHVLNIMAQNAAPYGFWMTINVGGQTICTLLAMDPIASGTEIPGDIDPYAFVGAYGSYPGIAIYNGILNQNAPPANEDMPDQQGYGSRCWIAKGTVNELWRSVAWSPPVNNQGGNSLISRMGVNPFNSKDMLISVPYACSLPQPVAYPLNGWKGISSLFWFVSTERTVADDFNVNTARDYRSLGGMAVAWDGSVPTT